MSMDIHTFVKKAGYCINKLSPTVTLPLIQAFKVVAYSKIDHEGILSRLKTTKLYTDKTTNYSDDVRYADAPKIMTDYISNPIHRNFSLGWLIENYRQLVEKDENVLESICTLMQHTKENDTPQTITLEYNNPEPHTAITPYDAILQQAEAVSSPNLKLDKA